jgi:hypothetical protein
MPFPDPYQSRTAVLSIATPFEVDTALASLLGFWADAGVDTAYSQTALSIALEAGLVDRLDASVRSPVPAGAAAPDTPARHHEWLSAAGSSPGLCGRPA